ncbi:thiol-disulfide oxidoreductase DCC family protein [Actinoallomurus sp. CA-142502]|uniref:thiol-disulfide oxidoreductase DCC family protein n=1 Tax=Actinoallomurus sp. CA-142502 TaxID=3239885 RepID=UPI003D90CA93
MHPILLYDGDCGFCTASARFIERHIPTKARMSPYQSADLAALGTTAERASGEVLWAEPGRVRGGAQAIASLLIDAGGLWRPLGLLIRVPPVRWIAAGVYHLVTVNRFRLPGGTPACGLPPSERPGAGGPAG